LPSIDKGGILRSQIPDIKALLLVMKKYFNVQTRDSGMTQNNIAPEWITTDADSAKIFTWLLFVNVLSFILTCIVPL
jgi:hypothetical protein